MAKNYARIYTSLKLKKKPINSRPETKYITEAKVRQKIKT